MPDSTFGMAPAALVRSLWDLPGRPTRALIDLDVIAANATYIRGMLRPGAGLMAVVKANGYGHGAEMVARAAVAGGANSLAVATVDEGAAIRAAGLGQPILVLGPIHPSEVEKALRLNLSITICSTSFTHWIERTAERLRLTTPVSCHVKVDTGMHRFGTDAGEAEAIATRVWNSSRLKLDGVFTHFADADALDETFTAEQASRLDMLVQRIENQGVKPTTVHAANSAATLRSRHYDFGMVRVGIALYGLPPSEQVSLPAALRPALSLRSTVSRVIELAPGDNVGYGRTYCATTREQAVLVPIGYADGYRRGLSSQSWMGLHGVPSQVAGRVSMDQTVVRVPSEAEPHIGDEIVVVGSSADGAPSASDLARILNTIPYEIVAGLAARIPRYYIWRGELFSAPPPGAPSPASLPTQ